MMLLNGRITSYSFTLCCNQHIKYKLTNELWVGKRLCLVCTNIAGDVLSFSKYPVLCVLFSNPCIFPPKFRHESQVIKIWCDMKPLIWYAAYEAYRCEHNLPTFYPVNRAEKSSVKETNNNGLCLFFCFLSGEAPCRSAGIKCGHNSPIIH